jgi:hypothetical protein
MPSGIDEERQEPFGRSDPDLPSQRAVGAPDGKAEVVDEASELLRPLLRDPAEAAKTAAELVAAIELHKGPLPHPRILSGYDEIVPGAARDILDMARLEQRHRHRMEDRQTAYP